MQAAGTSRTAIKNSSNDISDNYQNYAWLSQRAILAAKNNDVHALNFTIQSKIAGDLVTYQWFRLVFRFTLNDCNFQFALRLQGQLTSRKANRLVFAE